MMIRKLLCAVLLLASFFGTAAFADEPSREELLKRTQTLENEVAQLRAMIGDMQAHQNKVLQKLEALEKQGLENKEAVKQAAAPSPAAVGIQIGDEQPIVARHKIKLYGFLKLDANYDDSKTDNPDAARYALSESTTEGERQYTMTAMNSRLGFKYYSPTYGQVDVFGNLELDFFDPGSDNSQQPRMRHAFFELQYPKWKLLAGQTWDVFGPLGPNSLNTNGWLWYGGNIGFRRPQVRLTNQADLKDNKKIITEVSINRNIGIGNGSVNTGENSGYPLLEARVAYSFPLFSQISTIGLEGLYGRERYNRNDGVTESHYQVPQWAVGMDFTSVLSKKLSLRGEFFWGSNLDAFLAGIGQGINTTTEKGIDAMGGWIQLTYEPVDKWVFNLGYGIDSADKDDLNAGNRLRNQVGFINLMHAVTKSVTFGLEYAHFKTDYVNSAKGDDNRITTSFIYNF